MTFKDHLEGLTQMARVRAGRDYGDEPRLDRRAGYDAYTFVFDGLALQLSGPMVKAMREDAGLVDRVFDHYAEALKFLGKKA
jgi:hypothetical protein